MRKSNIQGVMMAMVASCLLFVGCEKQRTTEDVLLSVSLQNATEGELYIAVDNGKPAADAGVVYRQTDTVLAAGESVVMAEYRGEMTFADDAERRSKMEEALERVSNGMQPYRLKYIADGTLHSLAVSTGGVFGVADYNLSETVAQLDITRDLMAEKGAKSEEGKQTMVRYVWESACTLPFDITIEYDEADGKNLIKKVEPGEVFDLAAFTYYVYPSDDDMTERSRAEALSNFISGIKIFKTRMVHPDLSEEYNRERDLSGDAELSQVFDAMQYVVRDGELVRKIYNETLIVEFDFYPGGGNSVKDIKYPVWENGTTGEMTIDMSLCKHLIFTYGESDFHITLAPGEQLELNPWITYYDEGEYYVISPYTNSWVAYMDENRLSV